MTSTTHPPIPADVDLRGLDYMPLFGNHLFGSQFNAAASDSEWRAALTLWWAAWNQVPAGSLPNDDPALCRLADLGRDVKTWKKLRARALHGFVECSDGRLYHDFICKQALVAWDKRVKERDRKAKWRAEQDAKKAGRTADVPRDKQSESAGPDTGQDADVRADGKGRDGTGRDDVLNRVPPPLSAGDPGGQAVDLGGAQPTQAGAICGAMRRAGIPDTNPGHPRLLTLLAAGATEAEFLAFVGPATDGTKGSPFAYVLGAVEGERKRAAKTTPALHRGAMPATAGGDRKARQLATAAVLTGAAPAPQPQPETIDVDARIVAP